MVRQKAIISYALEAAEGPKVWGGGGKYCSDEFELEFPKLSRAELKGFRAESSQAEAFQFSSWNQVENIYVNK